LSLKKGLSLDGHTEYAGGPDWEGYPSHRRWDIPQNISGIESRLELFHRSSDPLQTGKDSPSDLFVRFDPSFTP
jgi:hypothetical protein